MGMQVEVGNGKAVTLGEGVDAEAMLAGATGLDEVAKDIAQGAWFRRYEADRDMDPNFARNIAKALFEGGTLGAEEYITDALEEADAEDEDAAYNRLMEGDEAYRQPHVEELVDAICEATDLDRDEVREAVVERLRDAVCDAMADMDESVPADVVPGHTRVEVVYYFGLGDLAVDDRYMNQVSNVFELGTVEPDDRLLPLFEGLNVSFEGFREHVRSAYGVDLKAGPKDEALVAWLTKADYIGDRDRARERALERAAKWAAFEPSFDETREPVLSQEDMLTVLAESGGGGLPCFVARVPLKQLLARDWDLPARFDADRSYSVRSGGFAGIFDPVNGSGYIERVSGPVQIPAGRDGWRVSGKTTMDVDSVFAIVGTCYYADVTDLPAPEPEPEAPAFGM